MKLASNPYVNEVVRIIRNACPCKYGPKAVVLVSNRFYDEGKAIAEKNEAFPFGTLRSERTDLWLDRRTVCLPVHWLKDYEFEIYTKAPKIKDEYIKSTEL